MTPVKKIVKEKLISALFNDFPISEEFRELLALKLRGMGILDSTENTNDKYNNSRELTS